MAIFAPDPYYDLIDDIDLIIASFRAQYGIRLSRELSDMPWHEFCALLSGLSADTALGRIVSIRAEDDPDILKHFTQEQHRIRNEWRLRRALETGNEERDKFLQFMLDGFKKMAGGDC